MQQAMEAYSKKVEFDVHMADGGVRFSFFQSVIISTDVRLLANAISGLLLACLSIPLTDEFTVWKHEGYTILCSGPEHATVTCQSSECHVLVCMTVS